MWCWESQLTLLFWWRPIFEAQSLGKIIFSYGLLKAFASIVVSQKLPSPGEGTAIARARNVLNLQEYTATASKASSLLCNIPNVAQPGPLLSCSLVPRLSLSSISACDSAVLHHGHLSALLICKGSEVGFPRNLSSCTIWAAEHKATLSWVPSII